MANEREFEPLMISIEQVLAKLSSQDLAPDASDAVLLLRKQYEDYLSCCCRRAHVVPYEAPTTR